jgi:hypothetical protein
MVPLNIVSALAKALDFLGESGWTAKTSHQARFLQHFYVEKANLHRFNENELRAWADTVAANLNRILAAEGFSIRFDDFSDGEFGVASILDVAVAWLVEGEALPEFGTGYWPGVRMKRFGEVDGKEMQLFSGTFAAHHPRPIATIETKSGDTVSMTVAERPLEGIALIDAVDWLRVTKLPEQPFGDLYFPMIDFEETKSLDWLAGLSTAGGAQEVAQALQQTKFKMNHTGARVKDAVALTMRSTGMGPPPLMIDKPFLLWIERPGVGKPIFYAYLDTANWKDPGSLEM